MSCASIREDLKTFVREIMKKKGILKYDIQIDGHSGKGENFLGEVMFITVTSEKGEKFDLVLKTAKRSEQLRRKMNVESAYRREPLMYSEVIPEIKKFLKDINCDVKVDFVPKIYWICDEPNRETLIMENLKTKGFRHWDRRLPMDLNHVLFILKFFGKYHATSMAMKMLKPEKFKQLVEQLTDVWVDFIKSVNGSALLGSNFKKALRSLEKNGKSDLAIKFKKVEDELDEIISGKTLTEDRLVITHGDSWMNNILLHYEEENSQNPSNLCFIDFQLSGYDTPVRDLSYFIYSACDKSVLDNFDVLLRKYHTSLSENLKSLGCNVEDILTFTQLEQHWKKYGSFGLIFSTLIVKVELMDPDEAPDLTEISESGADLADSFSRSIRNEEEYNRRMFDTLTHFGENYL